MDPRNPTHKDHESTTRTSSQPPSFLIIGVDGMIGSALAQEATRRRMPWQGTSRRPGAHWHLDLADPPEKWQLPEHADIAILCAARTRIADCEAKPDETRAINVTATIALAKRLNAVGTRVAFLSTNQVFPPNLPEPADENTPVAPVTEYGRQKAEAERLIRELSTKNSIIRLTKVVSPSHGLLAEWRALLTSGRPVHAYTNLFLHPAPIDKVAKSILEYLFCGGFGIIHVGAEKSLSYFDFAIIQFPDHRHLIRESTTSLDASPSGLRSLVTSPTTL
jgi:dTDP-4-dehydrorhamnose reductase